MADRENSVFIAKLAEQAGRFDEVVEEMNDVAKMDVKLTARERDLLYTGYWNLIVVRKNYLEKLSKIGSDEESKGNEENVTRIIEYKRMYETDITAISRQVLSLLDEHLIPSITTSDAFMFYYKMKGDFIRYMTEFKAGSDRDEAANEALKAYENALSKAGELTHAHYFRLGLALNLSVLYALILDSPERACEIAKQAVKEATLESGGDLGDKRSIKILRILEKNIKKWCGDDDGHHCFDFNTSAS